MEQLLAQLKYLLKENHWQAELNQQMRDEIVMLKGRKAKSKCRQSASEVRPVTGPRVGLRGK